MGTLAATAATVTTKNEHEFRNLDVWNENEVDEYVANNPIPDGYNNINNQNGTMSSGLGSINTTGNGYWSDGGDVDALRRMRTVMNGTTTTINSGTKKKKKQRR